MSESVSADAEVQRLKTVWTVPNVLSLIRLVGSFGLLALAWLDAPISFFVAYLVLAATDWIDGKIAVRWNQRSVLGARLDSAADVTMYGAVLIGCLWLRWEIIVAEWPWIAVPVTLYFLDQVIAKVKFGQFVSYHTRTAKTSWLFMIAAVAGLMLADAAWPLRLATVSVTMANLESIWITFTLPDWHADVIWIGRAYEIRRQSRG